MQTGKVNSIGELGGCIKKCYGNSGTIFNLENWTQTSDFPIVLILSSQEAYRGLSIGTTVL